jgi:signal peptidase I
MRPTLEVGDYLVTNKVAYGLRLPWLDTYLVRWSVPGRGDVVVFTSPEDGSDYVKRVIGEPGDVVSISGGALSINGEPVTIVDQGKRDNWKGAGRVLPLKALRVTRYEETFEGRSWQTQRWDDEVAWESEVVPEGHVVVLGDNRDDSLDSREFGAIELGRIKGRVSRIWWSGRTEGGTWLLPVP